MKSLLLNPLLAAFLQASLTSADCKTFVPATQWTETPNRPTEGSLSALQTWNWPPFQISGWVNCTAEVIASYQNGNGTADSNPCGPTSNQCPLHIEGPLKRPAWFNVSSSRGGEAALERFFDVIKSATSGENEPPQFYTCGSVRTQLEVDELDTFRCLAEGAAAWSSWEIPYYCVTGTAQECGDEGAGVPFESGTEIMVCGHLDFDEGTETLHNSRIYQPDDMPEGVDAYEASLEAPVFSSPQVCEASGAVMGIEGVGTTQWMLFGLVGAMGMIWGL